MFNTTAIRFRHVSFIPDPFKATLFTLVSVVIKLILMLFCSLT